MSRPIEDIATEALALSPEDKARLAEQLLASLEGPDRAEIDHAWAQEAERRIDALDRGEERTSPAEEVLQKIQARLEGS